MKGHRRINRLLLMATESTESTEISLMKIMLPVPIDAHNARYDC
jgi:hypothetical protein